MKAKQEDFEVDRYRLDDEWVAQPDLYRRYAEALAEARKKYEQAKNEAAVVRADVELSIRQDPDAYDLPKVTEGVVKAALEIDQQVRTADAEVIDAKHEVAMLEAAVGALDHRKRALSDLVSLHLADYFSKPVERDSDRGKMDGAVKKKARKSQRRGRSDD